MGIERFCIPCSSCSLLELSSTSISGNNFDESMTGSTEQQTEIMSISYLSNVLYVYTLIFIRKFNCTLSDIKWSFSTESHFWPQKSITIEVQSVLGALSALTFFGYTTNALETFFMSSTMLKSSKFTIENCPRTSCLHDDPNPPI